MNLTPEERAKLAVIFNNRKNQIKEVHQNWERNTNSDVLLVDGNNLFIRGWCATSTLGGNGDHIGGIVASLKSLGYAIKLIAPTRCIVIFDGVGGSLKRKQLYPEYKNGRKGRIRLNRAYEEMSDTTTEEESRIQQYLRFTNYLQTLPVNLLSIDHNEADDVIAFLATEVFKSSRNVIIMSSDKDFLQLCGSNIRVYSPTKKLIYGVNEVVREYGIHPNNFVLYRAMDGDDSDNVDGITGAGPKTIVKHFPWLNEEIKHTIDELISHSTDLRNRYKVCENIVEGKTVLDRNVSLMQLKDTTLSTTAQLHCIECMKTKNIPHMDRNVFFKMIREDSMANALPNYTTWVNETFGSMDTVTREE